MSKIIFSQILAGNGKVTYTGLYDENGDPVRVELESSENGVVMVIEHTDGYCCGDDCESCHEADDCPENYDEEFLRGCKKCLIGYA